jgi:purine-nucleoside phosphorylase
MIPAALKEFAEKFAQTHRFQKPSYAIILGSGLASAARDFDIIASVPYREIPEFHSTSVKGHPGRLSVVTHHGSTGLLFEGRLHFYEGLSMKEVVAPVLLAYLLGAPNLFITNAAGGVNPAFKVGDIMMITDHINLMGDCPLRGPNDDTLGPRFPDMSEAYSQYFRESLLAISKEKNVTLFQGIYAGVRGPAFETPAEYRYLRLIGADAVGMSTVPEVIMARYLNIEVCGLSVITDLGVEGKIEKVSHEMVLEAARQAASKIAELLKGLIEKIPPVHVPA